METDGPREHFAKPQPSAKGSAPTFTLLQDLNYFLAHREQLMAQYSGQYVAIRRGEIAGAAPTRCELKTVL